MASRIEYGTGRVASRRESSTYSMVSPIGADFRKKEGKSKTSPRCEKVDGDSPNPINFLRRNDVTQESS
jgi:hypothetical protein